MSEPLPEDVAFLAHYGVKGMKWGQRKQRKLTPDGRERATFRERRAMDKSTRERQIRDREAAAAKRDQDIKDARGRAKQNRAELKAAKKQFKSDRLVVGRVRAEELLEQNSKRAMNDIKTASDFTRNEKFVGDLVLSLVRSR